jgi:plastocyanin
MRTILILLCALSTTMALLPASAATTHSVEVFNNGYRGNDGLPTTSIAVGDTVTWRWTAGTHTVTHGASPTVDATVGGAVDRGIRSAGAVPPTTFTHTFEEAGAYVYYCKLHATMRGVILVQ